MINHDYYCPSCSAEQKDVISSSSKAVKKSIPCGECSGVMQINFGAKRNFIKEDSSMYGQYYVGFGRKINSYGDKRQALRELNLVESSDPVGGSRCLRDVTAEQADPVGGSAYWGNSIEEAVKAGEKDLNLINQGG
jgi:hypothetical protein|tara:strand:- start:1582 stop:1989 length:408 start_codon:yes stop_codon:yes gene_type:complete